MTDIINERANEAQAQLKKRAERLEKLVKKHQNKSPAFQEGARIAAEMIKGQSELVDKLVFDAPRTRIEQMRNLQLVTGGMNEPALKTALDAIDGILTSLEEIGNQR